MLATGGSQELRKKYLIETGELAEALAAGQQLKLIDATWFMPASGKKGQDEYIIRRLNDKTVFFDHDKICDLSSKLPHTMPPLDVFVDCMKRLDVQRHHQIVCYDQHPLGIFSSGRAAWMLRYFGADNVRILNGGLKKWMAEDRDVVGGPLKEVVTEDPHGDYSFTCSDPKRCILDIGIMHEMAGKLYHAKDSSVNDFQILDARPSERFNAEVPEPREGMRAGCIKNSINTPFGILLGPDGTLKSNEELAEVFGARGVDLSKNLVTTCGSGVTACIIDLALKCLGNENARMYDGSWSEYGQVDEPKF